MTADEWEIISITREWSPRDPPIERKWYLFTRPIKDVVFKFYFRMQSDCRTGYELDATYNQKNKEIVWIRFGSVITATQVTVWPDLDGGQLGANPHEYMMSLIKAEPGEQAYSILLEMIERIKMEFGEKDETV